jgi:nucleoside-diphosphate-sugar epimerase
MKVAITGHTRGVGKAIYDYFQQEGHEVIGFSRSNGYDLTDDDRKKDALKQILNCDIFVNNAFVSFKDPIHHKSYVPVEILFAVHKEWMNNKNKKIIVMGSLASSMVGTIGYEYGGYQIHKYAIDRACWFLGQSSPYPYIHLLKPGRIDTDLARNRAGPKLDTSDVVRVVKFCLDNSEKIYIREIVFNPGS